MESFNHLLEKSLAARVEDRSLRQLQLPQSKLIDFSSNDYLGLARSTELHQLIDTTLASAQLHTNGSTGSRLLTGNNFFIQQVEEYLASIFNSEASLLFDSGYMANLAVLSSIPKRGDTIFYDERSHASMKDGMRLSLANRLPFAHNNIADLERKLKKVTGNSFVAVESIYSMDGDQCPLTELIESCKTNHAHLIIDEAHSTGVLGKNGNGLVCSLHAEENVPVRIYTFGKGMGIHGACVAGSKKLIQYLTNFARPFIYTTAPAPHSVAAVSAAFTYLQKHANLQNGLRENIQYFLTLMNGHSQLLPSQSAIQSFVIPGNNHVREAAARLQQAGFDVRPILSPTVAKDGERLRIILHTYNTREEIEAFAKQLHALSSQA